jgi:hypothetical protein
MVTDVLVSVCWLILPLLTYITVFTFVGRSKLSYDLRSLSSFGTSLILVLHLLICPRAVKRNLRKK